MILILSHDGDVHAEAVGAALDRLGAPWAVFDPALFPGSASLSLRLGAGRRAVEGALRWGDHVVDLADVGAVYFRRPGDPQAPGHLADHLAEFVTAESTTFVNDAFDSLDAFTFPGPRPVIRRAQLKVRQLRAAVRLGFDVLDTVVGNEPGPLPEMFVAHDGRLISKQCGVTQTLRLSDAEAGIRYTQPVRPRDLVHLDGMRGCPLIVQEYAPKQVELRVTVVGDEVFAAAIDSQASHHTRTDWRHYDLSRTPMWPWDLNADVGRRCVQLVRELGVSYGAIDLVLTPDGRHIFLEINPSGQFLWVEEETGLPISRAVAALLAAQDRAHQEEDDD